MCRWVAYKGKEIYLESLLFDSEHSLIDQSLSARKSQVTVNADGFGLGWYDERSEPGLYHEIMPAWSDCNLKSLSAHIKSELFFAHVRASTGTATNRSNCHPFAYKNWLFMHNGQIGEYESIRWHLDRLIPEHLYSHRKGATDSELIFLLLIANGLEEDLEQSVKVTIKQIEGIMLDKGITEAFRLTAVISDGEELTAIRYSNDDQPASLYYKLFDNHLVLASEPSEHSTKGWQHVCPNHIGSINHNGLSSRPLFD